MQLGFGFGWTIFRPCWDALHIRGSHLRPLGRKFIFELVSKNLLMAGHDAMMPVAATLRAVVRPRTPRWHRDLVLR